MDLAVEAPSSIPCPPEQLALDFVSLVASLYSVRDPEKVNEANNQLQSLQRSDYAYLLAAHLFDSTSEANGKFFAALTVAIKLNHDAASLSEEKAVFVLQMVIQWFCQAAKHSSPTYVLQRISSTLVIAFTSPACPWDRCVGHVLARLAGTRDARTPEAAPSDLQPLIAQCTEPQIAAILTFLTILAEDVRGCPHSIESDGTYRRVAANSADVATLLLTLYNRILSVPKFQDANRSYTSLVPTCHLQWLEFTNSAALSDDQRKVFVNTLEVAIRLLPTLHRTEKAFETTTNLLETAFKDGIANSEVKASFDALLRTSYACEYIDMEDGFAEEDNVYFNRMVLAFCGRESQHVFLPPNAHSLALLDDSTKTTDLNTLAARRSFLMDIVQRISRCLRHSVLEEGLVTAVIEFWEEFVQDTRDHHLRGEAMRYVLEAIDNFCYASAARNGDDDDDDEDDYDFYEEAENELREELRIRLRDLLQVCCEEYGLPVFDRLLAAAEILWSRAQRVGDAQNAFAGLEATAYFLVELSESLRFSSTEDELEPAEDAALARLFGSSWFTYVVNRNHVVPEPLRKLALRAIGEFKLFFGYHMNELWMVLELLVKSMPDPSLAATAGTALRNLCDQNRVEIAKAGQLNQLLDVCSQYFAYPSAQREPKSALAAAVASVAESMRDPSHTAVAIDQLLILFKNDHHRRLGVAAYSVPLRIVVCRDTLNLLIAIGRALQAPDDEELVLNETHFSQRYELRHAFWTSTKGQDAQESIISLLNSALQDSVQDGVYKEELVAKACDVFKTGFRERLPGPFVFSAEVVLDFLDSMAKENVEMGSLTKLASEFTSAQLHAKERLNDMVLASILTYELRIMKRLEHPRTEPEIAASCLGAIEKITRQKTNSVLALPTDAILFLLQFSYDSIASPELQLKRTGLNFWNAILSQIGRLDAADQPKLLSIVTQGGPLLVAVLIDNIAGKVSRSDLDRLSDALRTVISKCPDSLRWLEQALRSLSNDRASPQDRKRFLDTVMFLRGSIKTRASVKDFWSQCKGTPSEYR